MTSRIGRAALWPAAGFVLGAAVLAGGQGAQGLDEKLAELEQLSARLRSLDQEQPQVPPVTEQGFVFDLVPLTDLVLGVPDWIAPQHVRAGTDAPVFGMKAEEAPQLYGTLEEIVELVRTKVQPAAWEEGSTISCTGHALLLQSRPEVNRAVRAFLAELRTAAHRTVNLDVEIVEAGEPQASALAASAGGDLDAELRARVDEAIGAGKARRIFAGRMLARSQQQSVLWHGAEVATLSDADVEVGEGSQISDPVIDTEITGAVVQARSTLGGDPTRVHVQLALAYDVLDRPARAVETEAAGALQMYSRTMIRADADLWITAGHWAVAAERMGGPGKRHFVLLRPTPLEREGGGR